MTANPARPLPPHLGGHLGRIYREYRDYLERGGEGPFTSPLSQLIALEGPCVGVFIKSDGVGFEALVQRLGDLGMRITTAHPPSAAVEGYLPIDQLSALGQTPGILSVSPITRPTTHGAVPPTPQPPQPPSTDGSQTPSEGSESSSE